MLLNVEEIYSHLFKEKFLKNRFRYALEELIHFSGFVRDYYATQETSSAQPLGWTDIQKSLSAYTSK